MPFILWRNAFSVGNELIDSQHQKLIEIINRLFEGISKKDAQLKMPDIFRELVEYTRYHFGAEEKMMAELGYLQLAQHKKAHQEFINRINSFKVNHILADEKMKIEVFKYLKDWLTGHIMTMDMKTFESRS
jgi:hemerythrin-like metal-binding protein